MRYIILIFIPFFAALTTFAQQGKPSPQDKRAHIEALKVSFITQRLNLTKEEAQNFWPVYNEYQDAIQQLRQQHIQQAKQGRENIDALTEKELNDLIDSQIIYRQKKLDLLKKYHAEFKSVLPLKKVALLYQAEDEFRRHVWRESQSRK